MTNLGALFEPFMLNGLELANRVVMAPMTRSFSPNGVPTAEVAEYYQRRAANGVGLIITEGTGVGRPSALNEPHIPRFHGEESLAGWKRVVDAVHSCGGRIAPQLWHVGSRRSSMMPQWGWDAPYESPSGLQNEGGHTSVAMLERDVADTIAAFAQAAADAERLGFDAVELHAAHGYLIDQFFWDQSNARTDAYGGATLAGRARFAVEVLAAIRNEVRRDFPVIVRLSQWKQQDFGARLAHTPDEMGAWLGAMADAGADAFHCSQRRFWEPEFPEAAPELNFAGWAKKLTGRPTITVGSVGLSNDLYSSLETGESAVSASLDSLLARLERGDFDLVAVGRALLTDPEWLNKMRDGRVAELRNYTSDALATLI